jgi:hypothetical protein
MTAHALPYDFGQAKDAESKAARLQIAHQKNLRDAYDQLADAEQTYKQALACKLVELHADGVAWTVAGDLARGDDHVSELRHLRDIAKGVLEVAHQAGWRLVADRKGLGRLIDWSMRADVGGVDVGDHRQFEDVTARRAA